MPRLSAWPLIVQFDCNAFENVLDAGVEAVQHRSKGGQLDGTGRLSLALFHKCTVCIEQSP
jgi:hypothetical protein